MKLTAGGPATLVDIGMGRVSIWETAWLCREENIFVGIRPSMVG